MDIREVNYWELTFIDSDGVQKTEIFDSEKSHGERLVELWYDLKLEVVNHFSSSV